MAVTDVNNDLHVAVATALSEVVPVVGGMLSGLVNVFWPSSGDNVWGQIEAQVSALIDQKLEQNTLDQVKQDLQGISNDVKEYLTTLQNGPGDPTLLTEWIVVNEAFLTVQPHFGNDLDPANPQVGTLSPADTVLLLPLVAQFATLHLAHLRDAVLLGSQLGMDNDDIAHYQSFLTDQIARYASYVDDVWQVGLALAPTVDNSTPHRTTMAWGALNSYVRAMQLNVRDSAALWPYFDASLYPGPTAVKLTREIFSDPEGTADNSSIVLPLQPQAAITQVNYWSTTLVNALQVSYGGVQESAMGSPWGTAGQFSVDAENPIIAVQGLAGDVLNSVTFQFKDGSTSSVIGQNPATPFNWSFPGHVLSSITVTGISYAYNVAECVVFGFRLADSY